MQDYDIDTETPLQVDHILKQRSGRQDVDALQEVSTVVKDGLTHLPPVPQARELRTQTH